MCFLWHEYEQCIIHSQLWEIFYYGHRRLDFDLAIHYMLNNNYPQSQRSSPST